MLVLLDGLRQMGGEQAPLTIEEGVITPIYLIELEHKLDTNMLGNFIHKLEVFDIGL